MTVIRDLVGYGRTPPDPRWPGGARIAVQIVLKPEMSEREITRLTCLSLFWHFLDIVWICVFSFVYLGSVL